MQQYFKICSLAIWDLIGSAEDPYPHMFPGDLTMAEFVEKYNSLQPGDQLTDVILSLSGTKNTFLHLCDC